MWRGVETRSRKRFLSVEMQEIREGKLNYTEDVLILLSSTRQRRSEAAYSSSTYGDYHVVLALICIRTKFYEYAESIQLYKFRLSLFRLDFE